MADFYKGSIPVLDPDVLTGAQTDMLFRNDVGYGLVQRDYDVFPEKMFSPPSDMDLIPESEWDARFDEQEEQESSLEHIYLSGQNGTPAFTCLDQGREGLCWAYSTGHAIMLDRLKRNMPVPRLNPHGVGAIIKKGRDEGGWCGESAQFATDVGYPVEGNDPGEWPKWSLDNRKYDTPDMRRIMGKHRIVEQWTDLTKRVWDRNLTLAQVATSGFNNLPGPRDMHWWSHSILGLRWVRIEAGGWGQLILNSWGPTFGKNGLAVLRGNKAIPNGALSIRTTT